MADKLKRTKENLTSVKKLDKNGQFIAELINIENDIEVLANEYSNKDDTAPFHYDKNINDRVLESKLSQYDNKIESILSNFTTNVDYNFEQQLRGFDLSDVEKNRLAQ